MKQRAITKNNHYVPCMYLKRFQSRPGWIHRYDLIVPDAGCPVWVEKPIDRVASATHLYTSLENGSEADTHEKWLNSEYETPAEDAIERALCGDSMSKDHWRRIVRFLAAQDVRTPARLQNELARWQTEGPALMQEGLEDSVARYVEAVKAGEAPRRAKYVVEEGFPLRVYIRPSEEQGLAEVKVEATSGRSLWLWGQRHTLKGVAAHLHEHQWTILVAPCGVTWPATDDPVIKLNFHSTRQYDFKGGWGSAGTEIFMPLDPTRLLYTRVGQKRLPRGTILDAQSALMFSRLIREHAFRHFFAPVADADIPLLRPRFVNARAYQQERAEWARWAEEQLAAEVDLQRPLPGG